MYKCRFLLVPVVMLVACAEVDPQPRGEVEPPASSTPTNPNTQPQDHDGDGYTEDVDCVDTNAAVHPGADERCNNFDDDCDGLIDEEDDDLVDIRTWYADADADGYGDADVAELSCEQPAGFVDVAGDCNDADAAYHPGAPENDCTDPNDYNCDGVAGAIDSDSDGYWACEECDDKAAAVHPEADEICNDIDDDCDGAVDGQDDSLTDGFEAFEDGDGDGYGAATVETCELKTGLSDVGGDCDDGDASVHPGAAEVCDGGLDNDCDKLVDDDDPDVTATSTWYADADGDGFGDSSSTASYCDAPSGWTLDDQDCDDAEATIYPGATETCGDGVDSDCDARECAGALGEGDADYVLTGASDDARMGRTVATADHNGDGTDDLLTTALYPGVGDAVYVVDGPVTTSGDVETMAAAEISYGSSFSTVTSFQGLGDSNGDGYDDLVITNPAGGGAAGQTYVFLGPVSGSLDMQWDADGVHTNSSGLVGFYTAGGVDFDGDGHSDLVNGSMYANSTGMNDNGMAFVSYGPHYGSTISADVTFEGAADDDQLGCVVASVGDTDGDGIDDLGVGAPGFDGASGGEGGAYIVAGAKLSGSYDIASQATASIVGATPGLGIGAPIEALGDQDGDGYDDFVVSAGFWTTSFKEGEAYVFFGPVSGSLDAAADADVVLDGYAASGSVLTDDVGGILDGSGDYDGDGTRDLLLGAYSSFDGAEALLVLGPLVPGTYDLHTDHDVRFFDVDGFGGAPGNVGDQDSDGLDDLGFGAQYTDVAGLKGSNHGAVYLFLGASL